MASIAGSGLKIFWQHAKRYKWSGTIMFGAIIAAKIFEAFGPIYYKIFFDDLTSSVPGDASANTLIGLIAIIFAIHFAGWICWRIAGFITDWWQPRIMCDLENTAFHYLLRHSYTFFTNQFAGSLVRRVTRLSNAFETFADQIEWQVLPLFVNVITAMIVVGQRSMFISLVLGVWIVVYLGANGLINTWKIRYDIARAAKDSESGGALADAISNSMNIKLFTGYGEEERRFGKVSE